jgi:hypothetical protein
LTDSIIQDNGSVISINTAIDTNYGIYQSYTSATVIEGLDIDMTFTHLTSNCFGSYIAARGSGAGSRIGVVGVGEGSTGDTNVGLYGEAAASGTLPSGAGLNIGVVGAASSTATQDGYGGAFVIGNSSVSDNYGLYINVSNAGAGNAYIGKFTDGTQGAGKVLTSDANGVATWQTPTAEATTAQKRQLPPQLQLTLRVKQFITTQLHQVPQISVKI